VEPVAAQEPVPVLVLVPAGVLPPVVALQEPPRGAAAGVVARGAVFAPLPRLLPINMRPTAVRQL
jgi:hypothetical protein